jgi:hypothetical protein
MLSPVGKVSFLSLAEPDTRFFQDGVYSITLEIPPEDSKEFLLELDALMKKSLESAKAESGNKRIKAASVPYELLEDQSLKLRFKMKAGVLGLTVLCF